MKTPLLPLLLLFFLFSLTRVSPVYSATVEDWKPIDPASLAMKELLIEKDAELKPSSGKLESTTIRKVTSSSITIYVSKFSLNEVASRKAKSTCLLEIYLEQK